MAMSGSVIDRAEFSLFYLYLYGLTLIGNLKDIMQSQNVKCAIEVFKIILIYLPVAKFPRTFLPQDPRSCLVESLGIQRLPRIQWIIYLSV